MTPSQQSVIRQLYKAFGYGWFTTLDIPQRMITIVKNMSKAGVIEKQDNQYRLTDKLAQYIER